MNSVIEIEGLRKRFRAKHGFRDLLPWSRRTYVETLRGIDLLVPENEVFGLLGPNGAGKTTMFKILGTLILPTEGQAWVDGIDVASSPEKVKQILTYVIAEDRSLLWRITGRQNLNYFAALYGLTKKESDRRIPELLHMLDLEEAADRRVMSYSSGMKQKLALARGLLPDPKVLLLDEPTRSLDPLAARQLWQFVRGDLVAKQGKTILVATHNMDEVKDYCDRVAVLHRGQIMAKGNKADVIATANLEQRYEIGFFMSESDISGFRATLNGNVRSLSESSTSGVPNLLTLSVGDAHGEIPGVVDSIVGHHGRVISCAPVQHSLTEALESLAGGPRSQP